MNWWQATGLGLAFFPVGFLVFASYCHPAFLPVPLGFGALMAWGMCRGAGRPTLGVASLSVLFTLLATVVGTMVPAVVGPHGVSLDAFVNMVAHHPGTTVLVYVLGVGGVVVETFYLSRKEKHSTHAIA